MLSEKEALLADTLENVAHLLDVTNEAHKPMLVESLVALALVHEEPIEFSYGLYGLKEPPSLLKPLLQLNEWEWACQLVAALPAETVVYVELEQALQWSIVVHSTEGACGRLEVPLTTATDTQMTGAVSIVQSALRYHSMSVFLGTQEAWCQYLNTLS